MSFTGIKGANNDPQLQELNEEEVHASDASDEDQDCGVGKDLKNKTFSTDISDSIQSSSAEELFHPTRNDPFTSSESKPRTYNQSRYRKSHDQSYLGASLYDYRSPYLANQDEDLLSRTIADCGLHAFGCIFIEAWVLSTDKRHLTRPPGGHWMDPAFIHSFENPEQALEVDEHAPDCAPGEGLAGNLFRETSRWRNPNKNGKKIHWRQIKSMNDDPFIPKGIEKRMEKIHSLGIGMAATVPFAFQDRIGIVIFMSRSTADIRKLKNEANERYLVGAADLIGAAFAIRIPRMECSNIRRDLFQGAVKKVVGQVKNKGEDFASFVEQVMNIKQNRKRPTDGPFTAMNGSAFHFEKTPSVLPDFSGGPAPWEKHNTLIDPLYMIKSWVGIVFHHVEQSFYKFGGAGVHGPPRQSTSECVAIFVGSFIVLSVILRLAEYLSDKTTDWTYDGNWYSSTLCIIFALTPAPVGQPRQILLAHLWCGLVGYIFQQIPSNPDIENFQDLAAAGPDLREGIVPLQWKQALSVALGISGQAFFGILHPPATGLAFTFATLPNWDIKNLISVMVGDSVMIMMSMIILNLQPRKQYPMYWLGFSWKSPEGIKRSAKFFKPKWKKTSNINKSIQISEKGCPFERSVPQNEEKVSEVDV